MLIQVPVAIATTTVWVTVAMMTTNSSSIVKFAMLRQQRNRLNDLQKLQLRTCVS